VAIAALRVDALADSLRQRILAGELKPGTPLREEALSSEADGAEALRPHIEESTRALLEQP
jgi:hypothetical protein